VAVGDGLDDLLEKPLAEFDHTLLVAGWAEVPALAREGQEVLVAAGIASDPGEAVLEDSAVEKPVNDASYIRAEKSVLAGKAFIVDLFQGLEVVFHALIEGSGLRFPGAVEVGLRGGMVWGEHALQEYCKFNRKLTPGHPVARWFPIPEASRIALEYAQIWTSPECHISISYT